MEDRITPGLTEKQGIIQAVAYVKATGDIRQHLSHRDTRKTLRPVQVAHRQHLFCLISLPAL